MFGTCYMRSWQDFDLISLAIVPLFLFSGVFYPLSLYPDWLRIVITITPLYQGVALLRGLDTGVLGPVLLVHAAYLGLLARSAWSARPDGSGACCFPSSPECVDRLSALASGRAPKGVERRSLLMKPRERPSTGCGQDG